MDFDRNIDRKDPLPDNASVASSFVSVSPTPSVNSATLEDEPPPYSSVVNEPPLQWTSQDPRSSSTQSLVTQDVNSDSRRKLLLIYIHGFMGNETSFQSFPAHVHNVVTVLLGDSHVVHTKIYPRYLTKRVLGAAAAEFSKWLEPHEGPHTDIIFMGHSMGGLLAAEATLLPPALQSPWPLRHRVLGTINFDVPFLGMHPGVVKSGLTSIFKPYPNPAASPPPQSPGGPSAEPFWLSGPNEATYNPVFPNDAHHPVRKGWKNALHFMNKHSSNLIGATHQLVQNHLEFGSCLAEFDNLKVRYVRLRMLEEEDMEKRGSVVEGRIAPRVRFVNYYTASTGRPKKSKANAGESTPSLATTDSAMTGSSASGSQSRSISISGPMEHVDPKPEEYSDLSDTSDLDEIETLDSLSTAETGPSTPGTLSHTESMPTLPEPPGPGPLLINFRQDLSGYKAALAEHRKETKAYANALKDYHKSLFQWRKNEAKRKHDERKANLDARAEELKFEAELRGEEQRRIAEATSPEEKKMAVEAMRERRKHEFELRREQLKRKVEEEKERRKAIAEQAKEQWKHERKVLKEARKSEKDAQKSERKIAKEGMKHEEIMAKLQKKQEKRGKCPADRLGKQAASAGLKEVIYDADAETAPSSSQPSLIHAASDHWPDEKVSATLMQDNASISTASTEKEKKDKKFCLLPPKDSNGNVDHTWQRVFMRDVDEVGAHCGLFFPHGITGAEVPSDGQVWGERYMKLVGDVSERIEGWVHEDMTERLIQGVQGL